MCACTVAFGAGAEFVVVIQANVETHLGTLDEFDLGVLEHEPRLLGSGLQERFNETVGIEAPRVSILKASQETVNALQSKVEAIIRSETSRYWVETLGAAGVPVSTVKFPLEMFDDEQAEANRMFSLVDHPSGTLRVLAPPVRLDGDGFVTRGPTAPFGSEVRSLLAELGFDEEAVDALITQRVTSLGES